MTTPALCTLSLRLDGADPAVLDDAGAVEEMLEEAARAAGLTEVARARHRFEPQGVSAVLLLSESHVAAHTWPETGTAYLTLTSCRPLGPEGAGAVAQAARERLRATTVRTEEVTL